MNEVRKHPFLAWLFDVYILCIIVGGILAFVVALTQERMPLDIVLSILALSVVASMVYHLIVAKRTSWLSFGERIAGRTLQQQEKIWRNPYTASRWPLFALIIITLIIAGNTWDGLTVGDPYQGRFVIFQIAVLSAVVYGILLTGRGKSLGLLLPAAYFVLFAVRLHVLIPAYPERWVLVVIFLVIAGTQTILALIYRNKKTPTI